MVLGINPRKRLRFLIHLRQRTILSTVDGRTVTMLLCPDSIRTQTIREVGHGDRWDRRLLVLWDVVHRMQ
jgi:hypothetical protein